MRELCSELLGQDTSRLLKKTLCFVALNRLAPVGLSREELIALIRFVCSNYMP